jgi:hypothetical protein
MEYLGLPESIIAPANVVADGSSSELSGLLDGFESVSVDPRYSAIAAPPAFQTTHRRSTDYIAVYNQNSLPPAEVLPPPVNARAPPLPSRD